MNEVGGIRHQTILKSTYAMSNNELGIVIKPQAFTNISTR